MRADLVANGIIGRNRRSGSATRRLPASVGSGSGSGGLRQRLGQRRPSVGGAAERVERRQRQQQQQPPRGRSRSRSRSRLPQAQRMDRVVPRAGDAAALGVRRAAIAVAFATAPPRACPGQAASIGQASAGSASRPG